ncbi:hypothetical protein ACIQCG_01155 [Streptomyces noursei]|uniref:hypothetical protein n=1 Tax=Streptomyces noursei TaxID=1971 RepID=UPI00380DC8E4
MTEPQAWELPDHFRHGDLVQVPPYGFGEIVDWADGELVWTQDIDGNMVTHVARHLRHGESCPPCLADFERLNEAAEAAYFAHTRTDNEELA